MRLGLLPLLLCWTAVGASAPAYANPLDAPIRRAAETSLKKHGIPSVSVAIVRRHRIVAVRSFGFASPTSPATVQTLYNLASLTKPLTAETLLRSSRRGWIGLDQPLADVWMDPDVAGDPRSRKLTLRLVLSHRTGFPNWRRETGGRLAFKADPGTVFGYSGEGYELAATVLQKKSGQDFAELMRKLVLLPAGMTNSGYRPSSVANIAYPFAAGRFLEPQVARGWVASDDAYATAHDYARFLISVARGEGLGRRLIVEQRSVQTDRTPDLCPPDRTPVCPKQVGMGLGWEVQRYSGDTILMHTGSDEGTFTFAYIGVKSGDGAVILTNGDKGGLAALAILDAVNTYPPFLRFLHALAGA